MPRPLTDRGKAHLAQLPTVLRGSAHYQAIVHVLARELDRLDQAVADVQRQFIPSRADMLLGAWERTVKLTPDAGATLDQRQLAVVARLQKLLTNETGEEWVATMTAIVGPGWTYEEHIPGDPTSPPANTIRLTLPFPPAGSRYAEAQAQFEEFGPAHIAWEFSSSGGFIWDESQWDLQEWGI